MLANQQFIIRTIQKHEAAKANMFLKEHSKSNSNFSIQGCYQHASSIFVYEVQDNWLGILMSYISPATRGTAIIETILVKEANRKQGVASALAQFALNHWKNQCVFRLSYMVDQPSEACNNLLQKFMFKSSVQDGFTLYTLKILPEKICVHNKFMRPSMNTINGEVNEDTLFEYFQKDDIIWGTYSGGNVVRGVLLGKMARNGNIDFEYKQLCLNGEVYSGHSRSTTEFLNDGRIILYEDWEWTGNRQGSGRSVIEEIKD